MKRKIKVNNNLPITELIIPAGSGIAQVIFHRTSNKAKYEGRYQNQSDEPTPAKMIT